MSEHHVRLPGETLAFLAGTFDLIAALKLALLELEPQLAPILADRAMRVTFGTDEGRILVALVDDNGQSVPLIGIYADPADAQMFGEAGRPVVQSGLYEPHATAH